MPNQETLSSTISSLFQKQLGDTEVASLLAELEAQNMIVINDTKVSYTLPDASA
jgi:hypothetical protein